jgi:hypothetical protein
MELGAWGRQQAADNQQKKTRNEGLDTCGQEAGWLIRKLANSKIRQTDELFTAYYSLCIAY